ncbi:hypothetical protein PMZ80_003565 [Knufia obscura]|uniref:Uncharacterized protein n=2 Tax=Knufia TaxID=430999 RepID=A0AAN8I993_9EURO|nr:hypothetical protein PMZ80_003565 [Knufia obscura]KAK5958519.1 hypothetical protein OHC33_000362 [Knufia fluminis]
MTTTSQAPSLPPPSPGSPQPHTTPGSARLRTPLRQSLSPLKRHLSPSKSRNTTPARSSARSPRKSPAKDFQSVKSVSFTPQRARQPPRAWERRPATPFIPRDEKQKIWKRVPLGELGVDINCPVGVSRRDHEASKDYARVVKKLKVGHHYTGDADENKENVVCAMDTKVQTEDRDLKRRTYGIHGEHTFVSVKMEKDEIIGSPKKKLRLPVTEPRADMDEQEEEQGYKIEDEIAEATYDESHVENEGDEHEVEQMPHAAEVSHEGEGSEAEQVTGPAAQLSEGEYEATQKNEVAQQEPTYPTNITRLGYEEPETILVTSPCNTLANEIEEANADQPGVADEEVQQEGEGSPQGASLSNPVEGVDEAIEDQMQLPPSPADADAIEQDHVVDNQEEPGMASSDERTAADEEALSGDDIRSSSPPTILAENVTIDELEARESPTPARTEPSNKTENHEQSEGPETTEVSVTQEALPRRISDDETAFLRAFMSRTKASKTERASQGHAFQHISQDETTKADVEHERAKTESCDGLSLVPTLDPAEPASQNDTAPASPLRRSKRAAVTSIPRPQGLPNSIQLKRANGNEFIFKANQPSSTANVAIATRSNTKKNRGTAVNVSARLEQLLAEKAVEGASAEQATEAATEKTSADTLGDKPSKKRKRDKNDTGGKAKKVLRWNDANLVSYQEAEKNPDWEDIEDSSQESTQDKENEQADKHVKLTLTLASGLSEEISPKEDGVLEQKDVKAQPQQKEQKVRRVRKGVAGTVNGTPAPKTRSKKIMDNDEPEIDVPAEEGAPAETSAAVTAATEKLADEAPKATSAPATTTRKSRMPVPASSRRGAAASASMKAAGSSLPSKATSTAVASKGETKVSKVKAASLKGKEDERVDLLGKRRLRVRS